MKNQKEKLKNSINRVALFAISLVIAATLILSAAPVTVAKKPITLNAVSLYGGSKSQVHTPNRDTLSDYIDVHVHGLSAVSIAY